MDGGEKRPNFARSAREGSVDTASFALPVLRETAFGYTGADNRWGYSSADLPALRGRRSVEWLL